MEKNDFSEFLKSYRFKKYCFSLAFLVLAVFLSVLFWEQKKILQPAEIRSLKSDPCIARYMSGHVEEKIILRKIHIGVFRSNCDALKKDAESNNMQREALGH